MTDHVFSRASSRVGDTVPVVAHARGVEIVDTDGRSYLDGCGGAVVVNIGHGVTEVADAIADQARRVAYVHPTVFASAELAHYADELAEVLPLDQPRVYPVSGGSEAVDTALKLARAYHLARGEDRHLVIARHGSYHGNSRGALDASGRQGLRAPYLPWLGATRHTTTPYEYRCPFPDTHPHGCGARHAAELDRLIRELGPVAAFIAEPISGAALGACVPPDDYWPAIARVCREHGVLLIADEVMTGFGRTGRWFACDHWDLRPDILVAAKGAASGYWPLGFAACTGAVHDTVIAGGGFVHGHTYSHHVVGAAAGRAVLAVLRRDGLVDAAAERGAYLGERLRAALADHPAVGDIRGRGLLWAVEFVADRATRAPLPRAHRLTERILAEARAEGLLLYPTTGCADGRDGDGVLFGPPFTVTPHELDLMVARCATAVHRAATALIGA